MSDPQKATGGKTTETTLEKSLLDQIVEEGRMRGIRKPGSAARIWSKNL